MKTRYFRVTIYNQDGEMLYRTEPVHSRQEAIRLSQDIAMFNPEVLPVVTVTARAPMEAAA